MSDNGFFLTHSWSCSQVSLFLVLASIALGCLAGGAFVLLVRWMQNRNSDSFLHRAMAALFLLWCALFLVSRLEYMFVGQWIGQDAEALFCVVNGRIFAFWALGAIGAFGLTYFSAKRFGGTAQ